MGEEMGGKKLGEFVLEGRCPEAMELAVKAGVTETTVRNWERRGIADAKYGAAKRLARALGVPMEDLEEEE